MPLRNQQIKRSREDTTEYKDNGGDIADQAGEESDQSSLESFITEITDIIDSNGEVDYAFVVNFSKYHDHIKETFPSYIYNDLIEKIEACVEKIDALESLHEENKYQNHQEE